MNKRRTHFFVGNIDQAVGAQYRFNQVIAAELRVQQAGNDTTPKSATQAEYILAFRSISGWLMVFVLVALQHRKDGTVIKGLTGALTAATNNKASLDTIETVAVEVVPAWVIKSFMQGTEFLKTLSTDEQKEMLTALQLLVGKATDGQPNDTPPENSGAIG